MMVAFIDDHHEAYGVEPICAVLPIAPSTYYASRGAIGASATRCRVAPDHSAGVDGAARGVWREEDLEAAPP